MLFDNLSLLVFRFLPQVVLLSFSPLKGGERKKLVQRFSRKVPQESITLEYFLRVERCRLAFLANRVSDCVRLKGEKQTQNRHSRRTT